jgi:hypothetical protein
MTGAWHNYLEAGGGIAKEQQISKLNLAAAAHHHVKSLLFPLV